MNKKDIRHHYLNRRLALPDLEYKELSQKLCTLFFSSVDLSGISTIHTFLPIVSKKEPDTWLIIDRLQKEFASIRISIPRIRDENTLTNFYFEGVNQIKNTGWGVPEPQFGEITPLAKIDLVIVPLLAFDQKGHRAGYGKGYYDQFLKQCREDCKKVGLSFFDPVKEISDATRFDIKLDLVITPSAAHQLN